MHPSGRTAPPAAGRVRDGSAQCSKREEIGELMMSRCFVTTLRRSNIYQRAFSFADSFFHPLLPRNPISSTVPLYNAPLPAFPSSVLSPHYDDPHDPLPLCGLV